MQKYSFVYCRKTKHQISVAMKYRRHAVKLCAMLNDSRKQYAVGSFSFNDNQGIVKIYPRKCDLSVDLLPPALKNIGKHNSNVFKGA